MCPLDCAFGEGDPAKDCVERMKKGLEQREPEMTGFRQLKVVELDEGCDRFLHGGQLHQSHLTVFGEKLKCLKKEESNPSRGLNIA